ncbi:Imidazole glycerol phosphate synthase subunit HisH 2 [Candidatus Terasakiella magnetica]|uniref:Imidazole glycerol phosphate synthase subunit HisH 2 n=2 Tax=Candidatus Terasakiella magnetica TaxID=1867952 RepID=A0A1C3RG98_9PROT|nr:Imidazole glycerol phosphate synthase subunit HisH 2 [Candidatus Terasakiella magnetica]
MANMIKYANSHVTLSSDPGVIFQADRLVLPGVGSFDACMKAFRETGLEKTLKQAVFDKNIPLLAICVGSQMLFEKSQEGTEEGLGWLNGEVKGLAGLDLSAGSKIPHMGWNIVKLRQHMYHCDELMKKNRFYFAHSYYCDCLDEENVIATTHYGGQIIPVGFSSGNITAYQFHPEKSHKFGQKLMWNFIHG